MKPVEIIKNKNYAIEIHYDQDAESPREWDNLGTMVCFRRCYTLGDVQPRCIGSWLVNQIIELGLSRDTEAFHGLTNDLYYDDDEAIEKAWKMIDSHIITLPLYLYDHSGITMRTSPFSCPWDSERVGFIYITKEKARKEYGWKLITKSRREKLIEYLVGEVDTYDTYLTGQMYGYILKDISLFSAYCEENDLDVESNIDLEDYLENEALEVDSCWGFYGYNHKESGLLESATSEIPESDRVEIMA